jgi:hypothetical protein
MERKEHKDISFSCRNFASSRRNIDADWLDINLFKWRNYLFRMLEKVVNDVQNYFLGKSIIEYYEAEKKLDQEKNKQFDKAKYLYLFTGKVIPALAEISAVTLAFFGHPDIGAFTLAGGEALRYEINNMFNKNKEYKKFTIACAECCEKWDILNNYLDKHPEEVKLLCEKIKEN